MSLESERSAHNDIVQIVQALWDYLPQVLWGALLFNLFCVPAFLLFALGLLVPTLLVAAVTIGPAWVALHAYLLPMMQGNVVRTAHFFHTWRKQWGRAARLGLLGSFPLLALIITLPALQVEPVPRLVWIGLGADFLGCAVMAALLLYAFPLLIMQNDTVRVSLRNAFILAGRYPSNTLGLLAMGILFGFGIVYLSLGLLLILPTIYNLFVLATCWQVLALEQQRIDRELS